MLSIECSDMPSQAIVNQGMRNYLPAPMTTRQWCIILITARLCGFTNRRYHFQFRLIEMKWCFTSHRWPNLAKKAITETLAYRRKRSNNVIIKQRLECARLQVHSALFIHNVVRSQRFVPRKILCCHRRRYAKALG